MGTATLSENEPVNKLSGPRDAATSSVPACPVGVGAVSIAAASARAPTLANSDTKAHACKATVSNIDAGRLRPKSHAVARRQVCCGTLTLSRPVSRPTSSAHREHAPALPRRLTRGISGVSQLPVLSLPQHHVLQTAHGLLLKLSPIIGRRCALAILARPEDGEDGCLSTSFELGPQDLGLIIYTGEPGKLKFGTKFHVDGENCTINVVSIHHFFEYKTGLPARPGSAQKPSGFRVTGSPGSCGDWHPRGPQTWENNKPWALGCTINRGPHCLCGFTHRFSQTRQPWESTKRGRAKGN